MWTDLSVDNKYEVFSEEPHKIRNKKTKRVLNGWKNSHGYISIELSGKHHQLHRVLATQFIPNNNPDLTQVDHVNGNPIDNRIENLRWTDNSGNNRNRNGYKKRGFEIFEELPPFIRKIKTYKGRTVDDGYYIDDFGDVYYDNGVRIRLLNKYTRPHRRPSISIRINNRDVSVCIDNL